MTGEGRPVGTRGIYLCRYIYTINNNMCRVITLIYRTSNQYASRCSKLFQTWRNISRIFYLELASLFRVGLD